MKRLVASIPEKKRPFQCIVVTTAVSKKATGKDMVNQFMRKKLFKCDIYEYSSTQKNSLNLYLESVHGEKK